MAYRVILKNQPYLLSCVRSCLKPSLLHYLTNSPLRTHGILLKNVKQPKFLSAVYYESNKPAPEMSTKEKLKKLVAEYGPVVIVFHIAISLVSLGICYLLISGGLDVPAIMMKLGFEESRSQKFAASAGTFAVAYAVHKVFAPLRLGITIGVAPYLVKQLNKFRVTKSHKS